MRITLPVIAAAIALTLGACGAEPGGGSTPPRPSDTSAPAVVPTIPPTTAPTQVLRYDPEIVQAELDDARTRWAEQGGRPYRWAYSPVCFCPDGEIRVDVIADRIVNSTGEDGLTVDAAFDMVDEQIGTAADVRVTYDDLGYPTSLYVDVDEMIADEEFGLELVQFSPVSDAIDMFVTDPYGCGYGFSAATPDQSASFTVFFPDIAKGPDAGAYDLADVMGELRFGTDLMANWCDDVMEEGEPVPEIDEAWEIIAGTLDITTTGSTATGSFTDVVALTSDGLEYPIGDVTITNEAWGVFAG